LKVAINKDYIRSIRAKLQAIFKALKLLPTLPLSPPAAIALRSSSFIARTPLAEVDLPLDEGT
jgi:hypothetical protein